MDLGSILHNAVAAQRAERMKTSDQLTLGELILKLEAVGNKELGIAFDHGEVPTGLASWRGSYDELAIQYEDGGSECYEQPGPDCKRDEPPFERDHAYNCPCGGTKTHSTSLSADPTVQDMLDVLMLAQGKYFVGYKGGDFTMGKTTPVWVANYGSSSGFEGESTAVVDVLEAEEGVLLITKHTEY